MEIKKPYEVFIWEKDLSTNGIKKILTIGSSSLESQNKIFNVHFKKNINGSKELTFKLFYQYIDSLTGEKVQNPYIQYLKNETKLRLIYDDKIYDFIIKNISEQKSSYTFSYQATDLYINELSKNGYGVTFDIELENNIGTVQDLGAAALEGTDWTVRSEVIPQISEEALIWGTISEDISNIGDFKIYQIQENDNGTIASEVEVTPIVGKVLFFWSSVRSNSRRISFIYKEGIESDSSEIKFITDDKRNIIEKNCQYYFDVPAGMELEKDGDYYILKYISESETKTIFSVNNISQLYRGKKYVFSQISTYNSTLEKYVQHWSYEENGETKIAHSFLESEYISPNLIHNYVTNSEFKSTDGWRGSRLGIEGSSDDNAEIAAKTDPDYVENWRAGKSLNSEYSYTPVLKLNFKSSNAVVVNSGFYDSRGMLGNFYPEQKWILMLKLKEQFSNSEDFYFKVANWSYSTKYNAYLVDENEVVLNFKYVDGTSRGDDGYWTAYFFASVPSTYSDNKEEFLKKKYQIFMSLDQTDLSELTVSKFEIFPLVKNKNGEILTPENQLSIIGEEAQIVEGVTKNLYRFFDPKNEDNIAAKNIEDYKFIESVDSIDYSKYSPIYGQGAEKLKSVSISKSNYFNIIQTLAETFECWTDFIITRDSEGNVINKEICFKNYMLNPNFAGVKYGVNLKDIKRTVDSKNIVSKLIVPDGVNEFAEDGFCTIRRAKENETGEDFILDFSYYVNQKMLDAESLQEELYLIGEEDEVHGVGNDLADEDLWGEAYQSFGESEESPINPKGYYSRLRKINDAIDKIDEENKNLQLPCLKAEATLTQASAGLAAAQGEYQQAVDEFEEIFQIPYDYGQGDETEKKIGVVFEIDGTPYRCLPVKFIKDTSSQVNDDENNSYIFYEGVRYWEVDESYPSDSIMYFCEFEEGVTNRKISSEILHKGPSNLTRNDWGDITSVPINLRIESYIANHVLLPTNPDSVLEEITLSQRIVKYQIQDTDGNRIIPSLTTQDEGTVKLWKVEGKIYEIEINSSILQTTENCIFWICSDGKTYLIPKISADGSVKLTQRTYGTKKIEDEGGYGRIPEDLTKAAGTYSQATIKKPSDLNKNWGYFKSTEKKEFYEVVELTDDGEVTYHPYHDLYKERFQFSIITQGIYYNGSLFEYLKDFDDEQYFLCSADTIDLENENIFIVDAEGYYNSSSASVKNKIIECLTSIGNLQTHLQDFEKKKQESEILYNHYLQKITSNLEEKNKFLEYKRNLNNSFFLKYSQFISEGTWVQTDYIDDDKFYIDALSTLYNSSLPQVSYSIEVAELSNVFGYEDFTYDLADKTWVEDPEYFGYVSDNIPYREEIVITEVNYHLDDISKNTLKVQNFKNQFQDLFQKITATTQQVNYSTGAWQKAADFATADAKYQSSFLTNALQDASTILKNMGEQSVVWDKTGITVTDDISGGMIRLVGGAILIGDANETEGWKAAITKNGISADLITAGQIDVGKIRIMNGETPTFFWDYHGITAFEYTAPDGIHITNINPNKWVRFDRNGIYGVNSKDGTNWTPENLKETLDNSLFSLTWEGVNIKKSTSSNDFNYELSLSTTDDYFIKGVRKEKGTDIIENIFYIDTQGNSFFKGEVEATSGKIGGWIIDSDSGISTLYGGTEQTGYHGFILKDEYASDQPIFYVKADDQDGTNAHFSILQDGDVIIRNGNLSFSKVYNNFKTEFELFLTNGDTDQKEILLKAGRLDGAFYSQLITGVDNVSSYIRLVADEISLQAGSSISLYLNKEEGDSILGTLQKIQIGNEIFYAFK